MIQKLFRRWWLRSAEPVARRSQVASSAAETLEDRVLLSGNVAAEVSRGSLRLEGDQQNNLLEVAFVGGDVVVRGIAGTTINGKSRFTAFAGTNTIPEDLMARLKGGNDTLIVSRGVAIGDDLKVFDRKGATTLGLVGVTVRDDVRLRTGKQSDTVSIAASWIGDDVRFSTRDGNDLVSLFDTKVNGTVRGFAGDDADDLVLQETDIAHSLRVRTGKGNDDVVVQKSSVNGFFSVGTWRGDDFVLLEESTFKHRTRVRLYPGDDLFVSDNVSRPFHRRHGARPQNLADVNEDVIAQHVTDPGTGAVARADALRETINVLTSNSNPPPPAPQPPAPPTLPPTLTFDLSGNPQTIQSNGTLATKLDKINVTGETAAFAQIQIGQKGGSLPPTTVTADQNGRYIVELDLIAGQQTILIRATDPLSQTVEEEFEIYRSLGTVVRFSSSLGSFDVELFDDDAPATVENFLNYQQRYENSIIHRAPEDFVVQGGGFVFENGEIESILTDPPIANEFAPSHSNVRGTLSMALLSGQPDSGTSGWFINVVDNPQLDAAEHTVFGQVIGDGMVIVDLIGDVPIYNLNPFESVLSGAFGSIPLRDFTELSQPLTGIVSVSAGSTTVTGIGTAFKSELAVGDKIRIGDEDHFVVAIDSDFELRLVAAHAAGVTNATAFIHPDPTEDNLVLFSSIIEIL